MHGGALLYIFIRTVWRKGLLAIMGWQHFEVSFHLILISGHLLNPVKNLFSHEVARL